MVDGVNCWEYVHELDPTGKKSYLRTADKKQLGFYFFLSCGQGGSSVTFVNYCCK